MPEPDDFINVKRAAGLLRVSVRTVYRLLEEGRLGGRDYGPHRPKLISISSVRAFIAEATIRPKSSPTQI